MKQDNNSIIKADTRAVMASDSAPSTPFELMAVAVKNGADVGTLERIRDLIEWNEKREAKKQFDAALAAFQADCPTLKRTVAGAQGRYKFTPLDHIIEQIQPLLQQHGLARRFTTEQTQAGSVRVSVIITHKAGHSEASSVDIPVDKRNSLMTDPQAVGGALTFAQRYVLQLALGIVTAGEDRDGQGPEPKTRLERLAAQSQKPEERKPEPKLEQQPAAQAKQPTQAQTAPTVEWKRAAARLWRLLAPVRGDRDNWGMALEWLAKRNLISQRVIVIQQLDEDQLSTLADALQGWTEAQWKQEPGESPALTLDAE